MNYGFSRMIREIERELPRWRISEAAKWKDDHCENAWTQTTDTLHLALSQKEDGQEDALQLCMENYKNDMIRLLKFYKSENNINNSDAYRESLRNE